VIVVPAGLRRFVTPIDTTPNRPDFVPQRSKAPPPGESCEMCGAGLVDEHQHVVNVDSRRLLCTCRACYLLFTQEGAGRGNYRAVPDRYLVDPDVELTDALWDQLQLPVGMAFFFHNSALGRIVAQYPSPAGATESLLDLAAWDAVVEASPLARELVPDVEALIVRRSQQTNECYLVPIDVCYELVGRIRMHWTGFDGGEEARQDITDFFARVRAHSRPIRSTVGRADA
jgi:Family of unknown function (DUF5947)